MGSFRSNTNYEEMGHSGGEYIVNKTENAPQGTGRRCVGSLLHNELMKIFNGMRIYLPIMPYV
ncbi:MAG: hypothetical protein SCALA701_09820 [Candidatus Scalindua sp.]|nr:MAG: hypothetical protein SCALA701_09820 [Candidatus Scalindua sp.]